MKDTNVLHILSALSQLDLDASRGYQLALVRVEDPSLKDQLNNFRKDHLQHIENLNKMIVEYGGTVVEKNASLNGFFRDPVGTLQNMKSTRRVLQALRTGERVTERTYGDALRMGVNGKALMVIERNYSDERYHLEYIMQSLEQWQLQL
jgi:rubrerythrin